MQPVEPPAHGQGLPCDEPGQHLDDADQQAATVALGRQEPAGSEKLEGGRGFGRAAAGDREEVGLVGGRTAACAFRDVAGRRRYRSAVRLHEVSGFALVLLEDDRDARAVGG